MWKILFAFVAYASFALAGDGKYSFACTDKQLETLGFFNDDKYELFTPASGDYAIMLDKDSAYQKDNVVIFWYATIYVKGRQPTVKMDNSQKHKLVGYDMAKVAISLRERTSKHLAVQKYDCDGRPFEQSYEESVNSSDGWSSIVPNSVIEGMALFLLK